MSKAPFAQRLRAALARFRSQPEDTIFIDRSYLRHSISHCEFEVREMRRLLNDVVNKSSRRANGPAIFNRPDQTRRRTEDAE